MSIYGCKNKPRPGLYAQILAQDGYEDPVDEGWGHFSQKPVYVGKPFVMSRDCQYTKNHSSDPLCAGYVHQSKETV